jgi:DNA-binding response OmpR family regulator
VTTETSRGLILIVEDERAISDLLRMYVSREGFGVHVATDGQAALAAARSMHPAAIILDVGLPVMDGTEVCRQLRSEGNWVPILFCTARDDEVDRVLGLLSLGDVSVDLVTRRVMVAGGPVSLTATEFDLLAYLMRHPGRVYSREQLLSEVWGYAAVVGTRTVDVHVAQVRSKLGDHSPIRTVRGVGYSAEVTADL